LLQCCNTNGTREAQRADEILALLMPSDYVYVLQNYVRVYAFENTGEEGRRFLSLLTRHGYDPRAVQDRFSRRSI
jgi:hypothetical protein